MPIPPTSGGSINSYPGANPKAEALDLIRSLRNILSDIIAAAKNKDMQKIHDDRFQLEKVVHELKSLMETNKGAFSSSEMQLLEGSDGILDMEANIANSFDSSFAEVGDYASECFGMATALQEELEAK